jgi:hypothetical protein
MEPDTSSSVYRLEPCNSEAGSNNYQPSNKFLIDLWQTTGAPLIKH